MISLPIVAACCLGLGASLIARRLAIGYQRATGPSNLLPQIAKDLHKLMAGADTSGFFVEYVQLLKHLGRFAGRQLILLSINLATMTVIYLVTGWLLASAPSSPASHPLWPWLGDIEFSFFLTAAIGSLLAPFVLRSPA